MDISASTAAYFFALELDGANRDLAHIAVLGAVGDELDREGCLVKENREALLDAVEQGQVRFEVNEQGKEIGGEPRILDRIGASGLWGGYVHGCRVAMYCDGAR